jgi:hypothetical protein
VTDDLTPPQERAVRLALTNAELQRQNDRLLGDLLRSEALLAEAAEQIAAVETLADSWAATGPISAGEYRHAAEMIRAALNGWYKA